MFKILINILLFISFSAYTCPVIIHVEDPLGNSISDIYVSADKTISGQTDRNGDLTLSLSEGVHSIVFSKDSTWLAQKEIRVSCKRENRVRIILDTIKDRTVDLDEVTVKSITAKQIIDQSPFSVQAIDLRKDHHKTGDVSEFLNRASGVKLRSDGNLGSSVKINLGGLQGKAVRVFKDGIPIELFGHGFNLGTIPVNMLDRVEIYKGVMPLYLASDALGGGINMVTRTSRKNYAEVSYELGSFNTHRATANLLWLNKNNRWYAGSNASFNYSDNNYKVNVPFYDPHTSKQELKDARRFHDATSTYYTEVFAGIKNRHWVDDMRLTVINSQFNKEIQHDAEMNKVYGEAFSREKNYTGLLNYKKAWMDDRLQVSMLGSYSAFNTKFIDTTTARYGWDGHKIGQNLQPGEINSGNNQRLNYQFVSARLNVAYQLSEQHVLEFNELYYRQRRKGSDPLGAISVIELVDVLTVPAVYQKDNMALGLRSTWLNKSLESIAALKYYHFSTKGYTTDKYGFAWRSSASKQQLGYLAGLRWSNDHYLMKLSYEYASRLPDEYEIFGDAIMVKENLDLHPERSHNINLNGQYTVQKDNRNLTLSAGLFYRKVKDIIFLQLDIPFSRYINYERANVKGFEAEASYTPGKRFDFGANLTYQDIRRVDIKESIYKSLEGSRVPNVPYLFGNFWLNTHFSNVFSAGDNLSFNWSANYTHRFFLKAIPKNQEPSLFGKVKDFQTSLIIPRDGRLGQFSNNAGIYYHFSESRLTLSAECRNITNVRLYDNFNVQKPGRSFHVKLVYQIF